MAGVRRTPPPLALRANADHWFDALSACKEAGACKRRIRLAAMKTAAWIEMDMTGSLLYPLRFEPIYQYRLWGGRRLAGWLAAPLPGDGPIGEAWLLSDRDDHPSRVAEGPFKGRTITQLIEQSAELILGKLSPRFSRFPLLLKFLECMGCCRCKCIRPENKWS